MQQKLAEQRGDIRAKSGDGGPEVLYTVGKEIHT